MDISVQQPDADRHRRALRASCIGSFVEWFDFGIYAYLAPVIAVNFFPPGDPVAGLLGAFALFAVAFLARPLGGLVLGHYGDRIGRRATLAFSVTSMGVATFLIGFLPTYVSVGVLAPALLLLCRLVQGFSAGGEQMGAASFALEYAPTSRKGRCSGALSASIVAGFLAAAALVAALTAAVGDQAVVDGAWRIPFLVALPLALIGLYLRFRLDETPEFHEARSLDQIVAHPVREAVRTELGTIGLVAAAILPFAVGVYLLLTYSPAYLARQLDLSMFGAVGTNALVLVPVIVGMPLAGRWVDSAGAWTVTLAASVGYIVLPVPGLYLMGLGGFVSAVAGQLLLAVPVVLSGAAIFASLVGAFPARVRFSAGSIAYNAAQAVFGGTTPFVATFLVDGTGNDLMPACYLALLAVVTLPAVLAVKRSSKQARGAVQVQREDTRA